MKNIDFTAFDEDDVDELENYFGRLYDTAQRMDQFVQTVFSMLRLAKSLYENGFAEKNSSLFQGIPLDEDSFYELSYEVTSSIFKDTFQDCNEDMMMDIYVFCDPLIDRFCHLRWQYEQRCRLTEDKNPYRRKMEQIICSGFELSSYNYNFD